MIGIIPHPTTYISSTKHYPKPRHTLTSEHYNTRPRHFKHYTKCPTHLPPNSTPLVHRPVLHPAPAPPSCLPHLHSKPAHPHFRANVTTQRPCGAAERHVSRVVPGEVWFGEYAGGVCCAGGGDEGTGVFGEEEGSWETFRGCQIMMDDIVVR